MEFAAAYTKFWQELGPARKMVLATALAEKVTARMMSVVVLEKKLYFSPHCGDETTACYGGASPEKLPSPAHLFPFTRNV